MLKKLCKCGKSIPITDKMCKDCMSKYHKSYDKYQRVNVDFYHSQEWLRIRNIIKSRDKGVDLYYFYKHGRIIPGSLAHHIIELKDNKALGLDVNNLIWVSDGSHKEIHSIYNKSEDDKKNLQKYLKKILKQGVG